MGRYDGVSYALTLIDAYAPGQAGSVLLTVAKDRNGGVGVKGRPVVEVHFAPAANNRTLVTFRRPDTQERGIQAVRHHGQNRQMSGGQQRHPDPGPNCASSASRRRWTRGIEMLELAGRIIRSKEGKRHIFSLVSPCTYRLAKKSA